MGRRRVFVPAAVALALFASACTGGSSGGGDDPLGAKAMDEPAPALAGKTVQGGTMALADLRGKVVVVNFWATWCTPCRTEQPELVQLSDTYRDRGVEFLGVLERDTDIAKGRAWVKEFGVPYPSIVDEPGAWADDFAFFGLPDTYVIDQTGTIRWSVFGQTDAEQLQKLIDQVLARPQPA
jgi:thiol-disulfide isomerase/thioredoxin